MAALSIFTDSLVSGRVSGRISGIFEPATGSNRGTWTSSFLDTWYTTIAIRYDNAQGDVLRSYQEAEVADAETYLDEKRFWVSIVIRYGI